MMLCQVGLSEPWKSVSSFLEPMSVICLSESSDTVRDLLNRMATVDLITSTQLWVAMRDVRNRIVHDYLPKDIKQIYDSIQNQFGNELKQLQFKLIDLSIS